MTGFPSKTFGTERTKIAGICMRIFSLQLCVGFDSLFD